MGASSNTAGPNENELVQKQFGSVQTLNSRFNICCDHALPYSTKYCIIHLSEGPQYNSEPYKFGSLQFIVPWGNCHTTVNDTWTPTDSTD